MGRGGGEGEGDTSLLGGCMAGGMQGAEAAPEGNRPPWTGTPKGQQRQGCQDAHPPTISLPARHPSPPPPTCDHPPTQPPTQPPTHPRVTPHSHPPG